MGNMSYCRFQNTLSDLRDCEENIYDTDLSEEEHDARRRMVKLCRSIVDAADSDETIETRYNELHK